MSLREEYLGLTDEQQKRFKGCSSLRELEILIEQVGDCLSDEAIEAAAGVNWGHLRKNGGDQRESEGTCRKDPEKNREDAVEVGLFGRFFIPSVQWLELVGRARENEWEIRRLIPTGEEQLLAACRRIARENPITLEALRIAEDPEDFLAFCLTMRGPFREGKWRRLVREQVRLVEYLTENASLPDSPEAVLNLWETANRLEPRIRDDLPAHFRTDSDPVPFSTTVLSREPRPVPRGKETASPEEIPPNISLLLDWIGRRDLPPELVAFSAHHLFVWIHPFPDGNGHTARLLCCGLLHSAFCVVTLTAFLEQIWKNRRMVFDSVLKGKLGDGDLCPACCDMLDLLIRAQEQILEDTQGS